MKNISRRKFFKYSALASASMFIPDFLKGFESSGKYSIKGPDKFKLKGKKLIVVQLSGGNDGLNTVVPYRNDIYFNSRPEISISESAILKLNDEIGLNSEMSELKKIYDAGNLCILNSVGYPNPDRSHFRSMDIWQSGSGSDQYLNTGWIGRYLDSECENCNSPYSAIDVDSSLNLALKGKVNSGIAVDDPKKFFMNSSQRFFSDIAESPKHFQENDSTAEYLYKTLIETISSSDYIYQNSKIYKSQKDYPNTAFGKNLKTIAEMIISEIETTVYYVSLSGFDTHVNQTGRQGRLLKELSDGLAALTDDLKSNDKLNEVIILTFSEFGRRVKENASGGTDHGTANNIFLIGGSLNKYGIYNAQPDLSDLDDGDLKYEIDFRNVYSTILKKWLNADDRNIIGKGFEYMDFI